MSQPWPTIQVPTAPSTIDSPAEGVVALQFTSNRYHLDQAGAEYLVTEIKRALNTHRRHRARTGDK